MLFSKDYAAAAAAALVLAGAPAALASTLNGQNLTPQEQVFFNMLGLPDDNYELADNGDLSLVGKEPFLNLIALVEAWERGESPPIPNPYDAPNRQAQRANPGRQQTPPPSNTGLEGMRVFWVYSPSIFSSATGGSSGYIHVCPGGVYYRSSEGSISVGGGYNSEYGMNESWAGVAGTSRASGRWALDGRGNVVLTDNEGGRTEVPLTTIQQGRWTWGQTKYAVEHGKASCR